MFEFKLIDLPEESRALADFILSDRWPFHSGDYESIDKTKLHESYSQNTADKEYFWIVAEGDLKVGLIKLFDLDDIGDGYPMFDLRILSSHRGQGVGVIAVKWLSAYLFEKWPVLDYIQGSTREDNFAMRKVFLRCLYVKEGHLRRGWDGVHASILYSILRDDWESGKITPVNWDDERHLLD